MSEDDGDAGRGEVEGEGLTLGLGATPVHGAPYPCWQPWSNAQYTLVEPHQPYLKRRRKQHVGQRAGIVYLIWHLAVPTLPEHCYGLGYPLYSWICGL